MRSARPRVRRAHGSSEGRAIAQASNTNENTSSSATAMPPGWNQKARSTSPCNNDATLRTRPQPGHAKEPRHSPTTQRGPRNEPHRAASWSTVATLAIASVEAAAVMRSNAAPRALRSEAKGADAIELPQWRMEREMKPQRAARLNAWP
jgi:hypothetical protein